MTFIFTPSHRDKQENITHNILHLPIKVNCWLVWLCNMAIYSMTNRKMYIIHYILLLISFHKSHFVSIFVNEGITFVCMKWQFILFNHIRCYCDTELHRLWLYYQTLLKNKFIKILFRVHDYLRGMNVCPCRYYRS